jgi:hypothetical protein
MEPQRIESLKELKRWIQNPTRSKPIVFDWFINWFFDELLMQDKYDIAIDAYNTLIEFTMICEKLNKEQATERVNDNLGYYSGYSVHWNKKLKKYFPDIHHPIFGNDKIH